MGGREVTYSLTGSCPRCGAPIYAHTTGLPGTGGQMTSSTAEEAPTAHFTCDCRKTLPSIPEGEVEQPGTVAQGDRKYVERLREDARGRGGAAQ